MQTTTSAEAAAQLAALKRQLASKIGAGLSEQDLQDEFQKYLDYGVPVDQAVKTILRHHGIQTAPSVRAGSGPPTQGRVPLSDLPMASSFVSFRARIITINSKEVNARGESKTILWGLLGDDSGSVGYTSWRPLEGLEKGDVIEVEGAYTKEYNGKPQLNIGDRTRITKLAPDAIPQTATVFRDVPVAELRDGLRGIRVTGRILSVARREVNVQGQAKPVWSGVLADGSGQVEFTSWADHKLASGQALTIEGGYVRSFRGVPQYTFDESAKVTPFSGDLASAEALSQRPSVPLGTLVERGGGSDVTVVATLLEVRPGSGLVLRCSTPGCTRVLTSGMCRLHNRVEGLPDLRVKGILDDGTGAVNVVAGRAITEALLGKDLAQCTKEAQAAFRPEVILDQLREKLTSRVFEVRGNVLSDDYGLMLIAKAMAPHQEDIVAGAQATMPKLGGAA
jgi:replication factor A1